MLEIGFLALNLTMLVILSLIGNHAIVNSVTEAKAQRTKRLQLITGLLSWQLYLFVLAFSGFLTDLSFPPRFAVFLIVPAFIFTGIFLYRQRRSNWIQQIPTHWLIIYQFFRIWIETLFVFTVAAGILHKNVTIEGYNYDMVFAFTAPVVALIAYRSKILPVKLLQAWNFLGLLVIAVIIFLFVTTIYFPQMYGPDTPPFPENFGLYPYVIVPGFLMPSAVFIHVLSLIQLRFRSQIEADEPALQTQI